MAIAPDTSDEARKRERQRQLDALALKRLDEETDGVVEVVATLGSYLALGAHAVLVAIAAWLLTRGGPVHGFSMMSQIGAGCLVFDAILCGVLLPTMLRTAEHSRPARAALIACAAAVALTALPTVFVSLFGEVAALPFRHILYVGKGGLWMLAVLGIIAVYGAVSVWLAWRLAVSPTSVLRVLTGKEAAAQGEGVKE